MYFCLCRFFSLSYLILCQFQSHFLSLSKSSLCLCYALPLLSHSVSVFASIHSFKSRVTQNQNVFLTSVCLSLCLALLLTLYLSPSSLSRCNTEQHRVNTSPSPLNVFPYFALIPLSFYFGLFPHSPSATRFNTKQHRNNTCPRASLDPQLHSQGSGQSGGVKHSNFLYSVALPLRTREHENGQDMSLFLHCYHSRQLSLPYSSPHNPSVTIKCTQESLSSLHFRSRLKCSQCLLFSLHRLSVNIKLTR